MIRIWSTCTSQPIKRTFNLNGSVVYKEWGTLVSGQSEPTALVLLDLSAVLTALMILHFSIVFIGGSMLGGFVFKWVSLFQTAGSSCKNRLHSFISIVSQPIGVRFLFYADDTQFIWLTTMFLRPDDVKDWMPKCKLNSILKKPCVGLKKAVWWT